MVYEDGSLGAMRYRVFWEERGVMCLCDNEFNGEYRILHQDITSDSRFSKAEYQILDLRPVETFTITDAEIRILAKENAEILQKHPRLRQATVADPDTVHFGLTRMFQIYLDIHDATVSDRHAIFDSLAEARSWLGRGGEQSI